MKRALALVAVVLASSVSARADVSPAAQAAFDEGRRLEESGDFAGAAARFEESERLEPTAGAALNVATCYERIGRFASSAGAFRRGAERAEAAGETKRAARAREKADEIVRRASTLIIAAPSATGGDWQLLLDGAPIGREAWSTPQPIDGGPHRIVARAPGRREWSIDVTIANESEHAKVAVPELLPESGAPPAPTVDAVGPPAAVPAPPASPGTPMRVVGVAVAGLGVVTVGVGTYFALKARAQWSDRQGECPNDICTDAGYSLTDDARASANRATVLLIAGGGAIAAGAALYFLAPRGKGVSAALVATPALGGGALEIRGTF